MWKPFLALFLWTTAAVSTAVGRPHAVNQPRQHVQHHDSLSSMTIVTVTVDWLPHPGSEPSESIISEEPESSSVDGSVAGSVPVVTVTTTVDRPPKEYSSYDVVYSTVVDPAYAEPTTSSSSSSSSTSSSFAFTTTVTHHISCEQQTSVSSSVEKIETVLVTVTATEYVSKEVTKTVTHPYTTVVKTLSTRGPYAPPLTTW
ncbi:hypothetical protein NLU13_8001 [Sarocladium strictum]|uniref:Uncharacterized protein n=1 Tax=Sarocladium strictum TaxID=5046 RepID=A0AA39GAV0_SARSR|nr:hypothetical protein NLU13_8001 [Sarocladium strictum]